MSHIIISLFELRAILGLINFWGQELMNVLGMLARVDRLSLLAQTPDGLDLELLKLVLQATFSGDIGLVLPIEEAAAVRALLDMPRRVI
jgi:hypothetical protein